MPKRPFVINSCLSIVLSALLLVQGAMPAGYMPASVDSGWPVMLCPEGLPEGFLSPMSGAGPQALHHAHHIPAGHDSAHGPTPSDLNASYDHGQHDAAKHSASSYCPLGSAVSAAVITELADVEISERTPGIPRILAYAAPIITARYNHTSPRAPPSA